MDVFVLMIDHDGHGTNVGVYTNEKAAYTALANYCREEWAEASEYDDDLEADAIPDNDDLVIEMYFEAMQSRESYDVRCCTLISE
jgi:hypothetical protein